MKYLAFDRPLLRSANEGVMPFYILHQAVLLCIGYFVMTWAINDAAKWVIVFISSFIVIFNSARLVRMGEHMTPHHQMPGNE